MDLRFQNCKVEGVKINIRNYRRLPSRVHVWSWRERCLVDQLPYNHSRQKKTYYFANDLHYLHLHRISHNNTHKYTLCSNGFHRSFFYTVRFVQIEESPPILRRQTTFRRRSRWSTRSDAVEHQNSCNAHTTASKISHPPPSIAISESSQGSGQAPPKVRSETFCFLWPVNILRYPKQNPNHEAKDHQSPSKKVQIVFPFLILFSIEMCLLYLNTMLMIFEYYLCLGTKYWMNSLIACNLLFEFLDWRDLCRRLQALAVRWRV